MGRILMLALLFFVGAAAVSGARADEPAGGFLARPLADALSSGFFSWFHLAEVGKSVDAQGRRVISYKPSGPRFHGLTTLEVTLDAGDKVQRMDLWLLRSFIDSGGDGPFARDIAKSFLHDAPAPADAATLAELAGEIEYRLSSGERVITGPGYRKPELPAEPSGGYEAYRGARASYETMLAHCRLEMRNEPGPDGAALRLALIAR